MRHYSDLSSDDIAMISREVFAPLYTGPHGETYCWNGRGQLLYTTPDQPIGYVKIYTIGEYERLVVRLNEDAGDQ